VGAAVATAAVDGTAVGTAVGAAVGDKIYIRITTCLVPSAIYVDPSGAVKISKGYSNFTFVASAGVVVTAGVPPPATTVVVAPGTVYILATLFAESQKSKLPTVSKVIPRGPFKEEIMVVVALPPLTSFRTLFPLVSEK
jgi:hypothetical protein